MNAVEDYDHVRQYCANFGSAKEAFYYDGKESRDKSFILVEFENRESADEIIRSQLWGDEHADRTRSPKFNAKAISKSLPKLDSPATVVELNTTAGKDPLSKSKTNELLLKAASVDEQFEALYGQMAINDLFTRLRFLAMAQIEDAMKGMCPNARVYPYGSSGNGFGRATSDLDMVLMNHMFTVPSMASIMEYRESKMGDLQKHRRIKFLIFKNNFWYIFQFFLSSFNPRQLNIKFYYYR